MRKSGLKHKSRRKNGALSQVQQPAAAASGPPGGGKSTQAAGGANGSGPPTGTTAGNSGSTLNSGKGGDGRRDGRRQVGTDEAALTQKNYRLAKELSDLRQRHREETKNVTRLTMENMNLTVRCREALSAANRLKKELAAEQLRSSEAQRMGRGGSGHPAPPQENSLRQTPIRPAAQHSGRANLALVSPIIASRGDPSVDAADLFDAGGASDPNPPERRPEQNPSSSSQPIPHGPVSPPDDDRGGMGGARRGRRIAPPPPESGGEAPDFFAAETDNCGGAVEMFSPEWEVKSPEWEASPVSPVGAAQRGSIPRAGPSGKSPSERDFFESFGSVFPDSFHVEDDDCDTVATSSSFHEKAFPPDPFYDMTEPIPVPRPAFRSGLSDRRLETIPSDGHDAPFSSWDDPGSALEEDFNFGDDDAPDGTATFQVKSTPDLRSRVRSRSGRGRGASSGVNHGANDRAETAKIGRDAPSLATAPRSGHPDEFLDFDAPSQALSKSRPPGSRRRGTDPGTNIRATAHDGQNPRPQPQPSASNFQHYQDNQISSPMSLPKQQVRPERDAREAEPYLISSPSDESSPKHSRKTLAETGGRERNGGNAHQSHINDDQSDGSRRDVVGSPVSHDEPSLNFRSKVFVEGGRESAQRRKGGSSLEDAYPSQEISPPQIYGNNGGESMREIGGSPDSLNNTSPKRNNFFGEGGMEGEAPRSHGSESHTYNERGRSSQDMNPSIHFADDSPTNTRRKGLGDSEVPREKNGNLHPSQGYRPSTLTERVEARKKIPAESGREGEVSRRAGANFLHNQGQRPEAFKEQGVSFTSDGSFSPRESSASSRPRRSKAIARPQPVRASSERGDYAESAQTARLGSQSQRNLAPGTGSSRFSPREDLAGAMKDLDVLATSPTNEVQVSAPSPSTISSRPRRSSRPVSYQEPNLNSKIRKGHVFFPKQSSSPEVSNVEGGGSVTEQLQRNGDNFEDSGPLPSAPEWHNQTPQNSYSARYARQTSQQNNR
eukprot:CAMPEP_0194297014 /NCGR_PEP_ID=MMETSP0169-20130528/57738_1 /TAXON_ID=218684 /ORGANISM="Corethron pennatum, Strain L29A3" /LENGTH=1003 /DNA_ID=CAMNT_0039046683 /DNA_START=75 /DNA_END=3086 /DNA_ORIENTATION=-